MFYKRLSNDELRSFPYPNLMAELIESGYSICTLGDHMGIGKHCQEDDLEVWGRLRGNVEMSLHEVIGLVNLFNCTYEYLFSRELSTVGEKTQAYHRWYEHNQRMKYEMEASSLGFKIRSELKEKPYLFEFMKIAVELKETEIKAATEMLVELNKKRRTAV